MVNKQSVIDWFLREIGRQREMLFLWSPVAFGAGIVCYFTALPFVLSWTAFLAPYLAMAIGTVSVWLRYARSGRGSWLGLLMLCVAVLLFASGYGTARLRFESVDTILLDKDLPPVTVQGTIEKIVPLEGTAKRVVLKDLKIEDDRHAAQELTKIRLKTYHFDGDHWQSGDRVRVLAKMMAPSPPVMPGAYDFRFTAFFRGLSAVGFTMGDAKLLASKGAKTDHVQFVRNYIAERAYMATAPEIAAISIALLTGERSGIRDDDTEAMRASGLAHLLAISGLNIGLVAGFVFFAVRLVLVLIPGAALHFPIKKWAAFAAIVVAFLYTVLAGLDVPVVRSFIMTSLILLAVILDRSAINLRLVALAAFIVMLMTPEAILGPSFQLSFAAVIALIAFYQGSGRDLFVGVNAHRLYLRPVYYLLGVIATTVIATLATAPFAILHFNTFAVYGVLSNIVAIPVTAFIVMPAGLLAVLLIPFGLDQWLWPIMGYGVDIILDTAYAVASYPQARLYIPSLSQAGMFFMAAGFLWLVLWRGPLRFIGAGIVITVIAMTVMQVQKKIIVSEDLRGVLIADQSVDKSGDNSLAGYYLIGKINSYTRSNWLPSFGIGPDVDIPSLNDGDKIDKSIGYCDSFTCNLAIETVQIRIVLNPLGLFGACRAADIIITHIPIDEESQCAGPYVIDRFDVYHKGAMTITFENSRYIVETVH